MTYFLKPVLIFSLAWFAANALCQSSDVWQEKGLDLLNPRLSDGSGDFRFQKTLICTDTISADAQPVKVCFTFVNAGTHVVIVDSIAVFCGCTSAVAGCKSVMPGDTGFVEVMVDPAELSGSFSRQVFVFSNRYGRLPVAKLTVAGFVAKGADDLKRNYRFDLGNGLRMKRKVVTFSMKNDDRVRSERVACLNAGETPLLCRFADIPDYAEVTMETGTLMPGREGDLIIKIDGSKIKGRSGSQLDFMVNPIGVNEDGGIRVVVLID
jgi:hypothetical protein